jgi:phytoene dehydrogenase-like protein
VHLNTPVERIAVRDGRVIGVDTPNGHFPADLVVSNGDPGYTYLHLIEPRWLKKHTPARVHRKKQSMSLFVLYFGTSGEYPQLPHHGIVLGPRYRELLDDIFHKQRLADDFSLYLHAPKRTDGDYYPAGKDGFYVLSPVPNNHSGVNWQQEGERYAEKILAHLEQRLMPGLRAWKPPSLSPPTILSKSCGHCKGPLLGLNHCFSSRPISVTTTAQRMWMACTLLGPIPIPALGCPACSTPPNCSIT